MNGSVRYKVGKKHPFLQQALKKLSDEMNDMLVKGTMQRDDDTYLKLLDPNYAYLSYDIGGSKGELIAHSSINYEEDAGFLKDYFTLLKENPVFQHLQVGSCRNMNYDQATCAVWDRDIDTEAKLLEEIYERYSHDPYVEGTVDLYTYYEPCLSCDYEIIQFLQYFNNIKMNIYYQKTYTKEMEVN